MNLILLGPPGAGKGTQSDFISNKFNLKQISTGNLLREEIKKKTSLGLNIEKTINNGNLVHDKIVNELLYNVFKNSSNLGKLIFDGYPRNLTQINFLDALLKKHNQKISIILYLLVTKESIKTRIQNRIFCTNCQKTFNMTNNPPTSSNHKCDEKFLTKRSDDNIETILKRFDNYIDLTKPVLDHYKKFPFFHEVDGNVEIPIISTKINDILSNLNN